MATWEEVQGVAMTLPGTTHAHRSAGERTWQVAGKTFAWERPLRAGDLAALGSSAPRGPVLAARVVDVDERAALIAESPQVFFTTPHFANYPAVLAQLDHLAVGPLAELLTDAWLLRARGPSLEQFWRSQAGEHERVDRHADGSVKARGMVRDGVLQGPWEWFRTDGSRMRSGEFTNGEQTGAWTTYDRGGRVHTVTTKHPLRG